MVNWEFQVGHVENRDIFDSNCDIPSNAKTLCRANFKTFRIHSPGIAGGLAASDTGIIQQDITAGVFFRCRRTASKARLMEKKRRLIDDTCTVKKICRCMFACQQQARFSDLQWTIDLRDFSSRIVINAWRVDCLRSLRNLNISTQLK